MLYRVRVDLSFEDIQPAQDIIDKAKDALSQCRNIHPEQPESEIGYIILEECRHNEIPPAPCHVIESYLCTDGTL